MDHAGQNPQALSPPLLEFFKLVTWNEFGTLQLLPEGLGDLPLYPDNDGFHSVNGPTILSFHTAVPPVKYEHHPIIHPIVNQTHNSADQHPHISHHGPQTSDSPIDSSPRTRPERRSYPCNSPGCTWPSPFPTRQALTRHREAVHLDIRVNCPVPGCDRVGDNGIKRKDNLPAHIRNKHQNHLGE